MISHGHGNDPYSQPGCGARGEAAKSRLTAAIGRLHGRHVRASPGTYRLVPKPMRRLMPRADIETCSFDFRVAWCLDR